MRDVIDEACDILFGSGSRTLNVSVPRGSGMTALDSARMIVHAQREIAAGRARTVDNVDGPLGAAEEEDCAVTHHAALRRFSGSGRPAGRFPPFPRASG